MLLLFLNENLVQAAARAELFLGQVEDQIWRCSVQGSLLCRLTCHCYPP
jgi:hypothetical protein